MHASERGLLHAVGTVLRNPVPPALRADLFFGWLILTLFLLQVGTGILLSLYYQASPVLVAQSVQFIMRDVDWGWLIRGVHHWSSHALIVLLLVQLARHFLWGTYRGARAATWYLACTLLALLLAADCSGELLTWDDDAYWRATALLNGIEALPALGPALARILRGGVEVSATTLSRAYTAHTMFVPWLVWLFLIADLWLLARRVRAYAGGAA